MPTRTFPVPGAWTDAPAAELGFDPARLASAVNLALAAETSWPLELERGLSADPEMNEPPPWNTVLGPTRARGRPNGLIVRHGRVAARWGDTARVDMTFSVAKSYLALLAGLAVSRGLLPDLDAPVRESVAHESLLAGPNRAITWRHLLEQTSEWEGTLWDKPDLVDRNRRVGPGADNTRKGTHRVLEPPGTFWEYNDVRVNFLSLMLLHLFRRPLPQVLREAVMGPIGASDEWEWHAYRNAEVTIDGSRMPSVPGGSHWGGGLFISSDDHARVGLLIAAGGAWAGEQIVESAWIDAMLTPCAVNPVYGRLWWLNTERAWLPSAPASSVFASGAGRSIIWVDRALDLVVVARWIDAARTDELAARVVAALT